MILIAYLRKYAAYLAYCLTLIIDSCKHLVLPSVVLLTFIYSRFQNKMCLTVMYIIFNYFDVIIFSVN